MLSFAITGVGAYNQALLLLGGLFFFVLGGLIGGYELYWRLQAKRVRGTVVGVRENPQHMFFSVYRYALTAGSEQEATSSLGSNSASERATGRQVSLLVFADNPEEVCEADNYVVEFLGAALLASGWWLLYRALTTWPVTVLTWVICGILVIYGTARLVRPAILARHGQSLAQWRAERRAAKRAERAAIPMQRIEDILARPDMVEQRRRQRQTARIAGPVLLLLGTAAMGWGIHDGRGTIQLLAVGDRSEGSVIALQRPDRESSYYPIVRFLTAGGTSVEFRDRVGSNPPAYRFGETVAVLYDRGSPEAALIDRGLWTAMPAGLVGLFGLILTLVSIHSMTTTSRGSTP